MLNVSGFSNLLLPAPGVSFPDGVLDGIVSLDFLEKLTFGDRKSYALRPA